MRALEWIQHMIQHKNLYWLILVAGFLACSTARNRGDSTHILPLSVTRWGQKFHRVATAFIYYRENRGKCPPRRKSSPPRNAVDDFCPPRYAVVTRWAFFPPRRRRVDFTASLRGAVFVFQCSPTSLQTTFVFSSTAYFTVNPDQNGFFSRTRSKKSCVVIRDNWVKFGLTQTKKAPG